jgi:hypothetical protein
MNKLRRNRSGKNTQNFHDKSIERLKNSKIISAMLILSIIYLGLSEIIKITNENKENLYGKNGLLKKNDTASSPKIPESDTAGKSKVQQFDMGNSRVDKSFNRLTIQRIIKRDTITFIRKDTVFMLDTSKTKSSNEKYSYGSDDLKEGKAFVDPLTNSTISIFSIQPDFTASAILDYPNGFNTIYFEKPDPIKVRPGDSWNNIYYHEKNYKLTISNINYTDKTFSIEIQENN